MTTENMITPSQILENGHRIFASKIELLLTERALEVRRASQDLRIEVARLNNELNSAREEAAHYMSVAQKATDDLLAVKERGIKPQEVKCPECGFGHNPADDTDIVCNECVDKITQQNADVMASLPTSDSDNSNKQ